jgi:hypothetical protein
MKVCDRLKSALHWVVVTSRAERLEEFAQPLHILVCHGAAMLLLADVNWTVLLPFTGLKNDEPA